LHKAVPGQGESEEALNTILTLLSFIQNLQCCIGQYGHASVFCTALHPGVQITLTAQFNYLFSKISRKLGFQDVLRNAFAQK
jgi:hypothetical protein